MVTERFFFIFEPQFLDLSKLEAEGLANVLYDNLVKLSQIKSLIGLTIIRYDGKQPLVFAKEEMNFNYLQTLGEIFSSMEPVEYFRHLSKYFEYKGIGHLSFDDFDLFIAKIAEQLLLTIMTVESTKKVFGSSQEFIDNLYEIFTQLQPDQGYPDAQESNSIRKEDVDGSVNARLSQTQYNQSPKEKKIPSKTDLRRKIRSKLDEMKPKD